MTGHHRPAEVDVIAAGPPPELTSVAEDYLKAIWSATEWGQPPATVSQLATRFGTARATVSATLRRLADQGLVRHEPYGPIELTAAGRREAVVMVRRHRLIETFLVRQLGYGWDDVHEEAERLEHAASAGFVDRIDDLLGRPEADPHGDPIPARDGTVRYPAAAVTMDRAGPGAYRVVRVSDRDPAVLRRAASAGLTPGAVVVVGAEDGLPAGARMVAGKEHVLPADVTAAGSGIVLEPA